MADRFDFVVNLAVSEDECANREEVIFFHMFNDNGAVKAWDRACDDLSFAVEQRLVKSGWILAYGSLSDFHYRSLRKLMEQSKPLKRDIAYHVAGLLNDATKIYEKLGEIL